MSRRLLGLGTAAAVLAASAGAAYAAESNSQSFQNGKRAGIENCVDSIEHPVILGSLSLRAAQVKQVIGGYNPLSRIDNRINGLLHKANPKDEIVQAVGYGEAGVTVNAAGLSGMGQKDGEVQHNIDSLLAVIAPPGNYLSVGGRENYIQNGGPISGARLIGTIVISVSNVAAKCSA